jgi:hypothetical protein
MKFFCKDLVTTKRFSFACKDSYAGHQNLA